MYHTQKVEVPMPRACIMHNGGIPDRVIANTIDILPLPHSSIRNPIQFLYFEFVYFFFCILDKHSEWLRTQLISSQLYPENQSNEMLKVSSNVYFTALQYISQGCRLFHLIAIHLIKNAIPCAALNSIWSNLRESNVISIVFSVHFMICPNAHRVYKNPLSCCALVCWGIFFLLRK